MPVEIVATLKVFSREGLTRDALLHERGFNPNVRWKAQSGHFRTSGSWTVLGDSTLPPGGLVFVIRSSYVPPSQPGGYSISVVPEADPGKAVSLKLLVENPILKVHPSAVTLAPGQDHLFTATFQGPSGSPLFWSTTKGTISPEGRYRAPLEPGLQTVTVQHTPSGKRASALVTVADTFSIQPPSIDLATGQSTTFRSSGRQGDVSWSVLEPGGGTIEVDGTYTAPTRPGIYSIQAQLDSGTPQKALATVRVSPLTLSVSPAAATLRAGQRIQFQADISHGTYQWGATEGEISESGLYLAPLTLGTYQVFATSRLDPEVRATATVTVGNVGLMQIVPDELTLHTGQTQQFMVTDQDAFPSWTIHPPSAGTITDKGLFTAGSTPGPCSVMALLEDSVSAASVSIIDTRILPDPAQVSPGGSVQFTAQGMPKHGSISWTVLPASAGNITAEGLFTAGRNPGNCRVFASAGGVEASAALRIIAARIMPEEVLVAPGALVRFACEAFEPSGQGIAWRMVGDHPGAVLSQDGVYRAPVRQGFYQISASDSAGNTAKASVTVGTPAGLIVIPEISVKHDGVYTVWVRLKASNGRHVEASYTGELAQGLAYPEVVFSAKHSLSQLETDGPYAIERVMVTGTFEDENLVFDVQENLGSTEAFSLEESAKPWVQIGEVTEVRGSSQDQNGLLGALLVTIPVDFITGGSYRITASLTSEDGEEIDTYQETQMRTQGTHSITLTFDGRKIRARGATGAMSISKFTVEGAVVRIKDFPGSIKGYDFRMFKP